MELPDVVCPECGSSFREDAMAMDSSWRFGFKGPEHGCSGEGQFRCYHQGVPRPQEQEQETSE